MEEPRLKKRDGTFYVASAAFVDLVRCHCQQNYGKTPSRWTIKRVLYDPDMSSRYISEAIRAVRVAHSIDKPVKAAV